jgi:SAM-dependent methyltransferase
MSEDRSGGYWDREGTTKTFSHPVNLDRLRENLGPEGTILDYGCGYGRVTAMLFEMGYRGLTGVDSSQGMIEKARAMHPHLSFLRIEPPTVPFPDASFDAALLFAVLTCIPGDEDQKAVINELYRVVRPGGIIYISDYWLQSDD